LKSWPLSWLREVVGRSGLCVALLLTSHSGATAESKSTTGSRDLGPTTFVKEYVEKLESEKSSAFYARCALKDGRIVKLVFPIGRTEGVFIEGGEGGTAVNTATVTWKNGGWQTDDAMGGVQTLKRINALIRQLLNSPFRIATADRLRAPEKKDSISRCKEPAF